MHSASGRSLVVLGFSALVTAAACGPAVTMGDTHFGDVPTSAGVELCRWEGPARPGTVRTPRGGVPYLRVHQAEAVASLRRGENGLALEMLLRSSSGGWNLAASADPGEDNVLSLREALWRR